jgi:nucleoside-diphosphate-sugar epimerase
VDVGRVEPHRERIIFDTHVNTGLTAPLVVDSLKILVTGASGFIGRHVVRHLASLGHDVSALDFRPPPQPHPGSVDTVHCDIRQDPFPDRTFSAIVHLAALPGVRPSLDRPVQYEEANVIGTLRLLEFCREQSIKQFIFASSSSVYGPDAPLREQASPPTQDGLLAGGGAPTGQKLVNG